MALVDSRTGDLELSLKLYHRREVQLDYQQLMTEAPVTSGGKEANRAEVDAIYRELTQFTSSDQKHSSEARANPTL